jgi:hypothetical protein
VAPPEGAFGSIMTAAAWGPSRDRTISSPSSGIWRVHGRQPEQEEKIKIKKDENNLFSPRRAAIFTKIRRNKPISARWSYQVAKPYLLPHFKNSKKKNRNVNSR